MRIFVIAVIFVLVPLAYADQIYKWTDANGRVHYTNEKPPADAKVESLKIEKHEADPSVNIEAERKRWAEQSEAFEQRRREREAVSAKEEREQGAGQAERRVKCRVAKEELARLNGTSARLATIAQSRKDYDTGALNNAERRARIAEVEADIKTWCTR